MKKERGITLVALVITVVVMLILAGVAISALTTQGGLFEKTKNATTEYKTQSQNENQTVYNVENILDVEYYNLTNP